MTVGEAVEFIRKRSAAATNDDRPGDPSPCAVFGSPSALARRLMSGVVPDDELELLLRATMAHALETVEAIRMASEESAESVRGTVFVCLVQATLMGHLLDRDVAS